MIIRQFAAAMPLQDKVVRVVSDDTGICCSIGALIYQTYCAMLPVAKQSGSV